MQRQLLFTLFAGALLALAMPVTAQQVAPPDTLTPIVEPIPPEGPIPRSAFIRALLVPGWGHFAMGETKRGAVYFGLQTTSWAMLATTMHRLSGARDAERGIHTLAVDSLEQQMAADTALARRLGEDLQAWEDALLAYPGLADARSLVRARERHRQDWIVYTLVTTFAAAIDAYVTAHLADFPVEITATRSRDSGLAMGVRVPVGRSR